ncbi:MAG: M23 family metallopeptidase [Nitrospiraceae bacterium]|nr:M23 family metallopeptidase [Nitrospiraceae bacterium]
MGRRIRVFPRLFLVSVLLLLPLRAASGASAGEGEGGLSLPQGGLLLLLLPEKAPVRALSFDGRRISLFPWKEEGRSGEPHRFMAALLGVDFSRSPGRLRLDLDRSDGKIEQHLLRVTPRSFQVSRLTVARSFVTPPASLLARLRRERRTIALALSPPDAPLRFHRPFMAPLEGKVTHDFGAYRFLNGHPMARHSGEDIDVPQGTPVRAANDGVVRLTGSFYYDGNMVILDHGGGLLTEYLHMSDIRVRPGERVRRGQVVGHVGHTGRVTGPVLHYGAVLHGAHVNPMLLPGLLSGAVTLGGGKH